MDGDLSGLVVSISTDLSELKKGLSEAASQVQDAANAMAIGLTAVTAAMTIGIKSALDYGDQIYRMSQITGESAETLSRLKYAAEQNDVSFESLARSLELLTKNVFLANNGSTKMAEAFAQLGLSVTDLKNKSPEELLGIISQRFQALGGGAQATALIMEVFGRNAMQLIPILKLSSSEMQNLFDKSDALGATISGKEAQALHDFANNIKDFQVSLRAVWIEIANEVMPAVKDFLKALEDSHVIKDTAEAFKETLEIIIKLPPYIKLVTAAMLLLSNAVGQVTAACLLFPDIIKGWGYVFAEIGVLILKTGQVITTSLLGPLAKVLPIFNYLQAGINEINKSITLVAMNSKPTIIEKLYTDTVKMQKELKSATSDVDKFAKSFQGLTFGGGGAGVSTGINKAFSEIQSGIKSMGDGFNTALTSMETNLTNFSKVAEDFTTQFSTGMSQAITDGIMGTKTWTQAFQDLGKQMIEMVLNYTIQWGVFELLQLARGAAMGAAQIAQAFTVGNATAAAYAPAAAFAEIMSFGGASVPADAGLVSTFALAEALSFPKMAEGGIVTRPTIAMIGEAGPEAVVPLGKGKGGVNINVTVNVDKIASEGMNINQLAQKLGYDINQKLKRVGGGAKFR